MPTQFIVPLAVGNSVASVGKLSVPKYLSLDAEGASQSDVAGIGARKMLRMDAAGENAQTIRTIVGVPFAVAITGNGEVTWLLDVPDRTSAAVAFLAQGENAVVVPALRVGLPPVHAIGAGTATADFTPFMPAIREPAWNELRGTINLVRNASVENTAVGLLDWATAGTSAATTTAQAWHGARSVAVTFFVAANNNVSVRTQRGLGFTGTPAHRFVGSVSLLGTIPQILLLLRVTYTDATTTDLSTALFDLAATDWVRVSSDVLEVNAAKTVDYLTLFVVKPTAVVSNTTIWVDGAQIEEDRGEGATPFAQGDMGEAFAWLGPAGLSMSLRETMAVMV